MSSAPSSLSTASIGGLGISRLALLGMTTVQAPTLPNNPVQRATAHGDAHVEQQQRQHGRRDMRVERRVSGGEISYEIGVALEDRLNGGDDHAFGVKRVLL